MSQIYSGRSILTMFVECVLLVRVSAFVFEGCRKLERSFTKLTLSIPL